jgi:hypothetical protein
VDRERAAGLQVLGLLDYSNSWGYRTHATMPHRAMDRLSAEFARYVRAVVRHFRGRISHWEIWNEPNIRTFWRPRPDPGDYALLLSRAYRAIKRVDPRATVVMGGMSGVDLYFLDAVAARTNAFDAIAVHPYRVVPEDQLLRQIAALRTFHRPLWFTEIGWAASKRCPLCTDEETQAEDLVRFYTLAAAAGVRHIFWYDLRDDLHVPSNPEGHFGLLHRNLAGKPAFAAFRVLSHALAGARFLSADILDRSGVYALRFQSSRGTVAVLWNTSHINQTVSAVWTAHSATLRLLDGRIVRPSAAGEGAVAIPLSARSDPVFLVDSALSPRQPPGPPLWLIRHRTVSRHHRVVHPRRPAVRARRRAQRRRARTVVRRTRPARRAPTPSTQRPRHRATPVVTHGAKVGPTSVPTSVPTPSATPIVDASPSPSPVIGSATPPVPTATPTVLIPAPP